MLVGLAGVVAPAAYSMFKSSEERRNCDIAWNVSQFTFILASRLPKHNSLNFFKFQTSYCSSMPVKEPLVYPNRIRSPNRGDSKAALSYYSQ